VELFNHILWDTEVFYGGPAFGGEVVHAGGSARNELLTAVATFIFEEGEVSSAFDAKFTACT
jgi:hypothetical protein